MSVLRPVRVPVLLLAFVLAPLAARGQQPACTTGTIVTTSGPVCGLAPVTGGPKVSAYLGVPFAQAQRWQLPQPPQSWKSTFSATQLGSICPQPSLTGAPLSANQSEDCLNLNVWVPQGTSSANSLPVLVFVYGGAFLAGSADQPVDQGANLAAAGNVIVVTFNYRLGALGFLVQEDFNIAGNFGFLDQIAALLWVKSNIGAFGGDANNVTIFGQSAGAMSVGLHALSSPQSLNHFKAAIMESNPLGLAYMTPSQASTVGGSLVSALDCSGFQSQQACLQGIDFRKIVEAQKIVTQSFLTAGNTALPFAPVIDGVVLTQQPVAAAEAGKLRIPTILGANQNDGTLFAALAKLELPFEAYSKFLASLVGPENVSSVLAKSKYQCKLWPCTNPMAEVITDYVFACANRHLAQTAPGSTYAYQFSAVTPGCNPWLLAPKCNLQACHGAELPYVFGTPGAIPKCSFGPGQVELSNAIQAYWTSFARSQSPSGPAPWPPLQSANNYMIFSSGSPQMAVDPLSSESNCALWDSIGYQQTAFWDRFLASRRGR